MRLKAKLLTWGVLGMGAATVMSSDVSASAVQQESQMYCHESNQGCCDCSNVLNGGTYFCYGPELYKDGFAECGMFSGCGATTCVITWN
jgi:hypothetical protein